jgi:hypothetical protein
VISGTLERISLSCVWREYARYNPHARLGVRDLGDGLVVLVIFHPISKGYEQVFLSAREAIAFAYDELVAYAFVEEIKRKEGLCSDAICT